LSIFRTVRVIALAIACTLLLYGCASDASFDHSLAETLYKTLSDSGVAAAAAQYRTLKKQYDKPGSTAYDFSEPVLNRLGYRLLNQNKLNEAIAIFKLNVDTYPNAANPYDSLAEAYMREGSTDRAIENYTLSLARNPGNANAYSMLAQLGVTHELGGPAELSSFLDGVVNSQLKRFQVPGAVLTIVKDGRELFNRGYGSARLEPQTPVDAEKSLFRVASITKVFTATAVMQQVEKGKLDLDTDINNYLDFELKRNFDAPVTLTHLLTHTAGFEISDIGDAAHTPREVIPLGSFVRHHMTNQALEPGKFFSYTNHGYTLAGYILESATQTPFAKYLQTHILDALGMRNSTAFQPPAPSVVDNVAIGYQVQNDNFVPLPLDFSNVAPADVMLASGSDMAKFMLAHLANTDTPLLSAEMKHRMQERAFSNHPRFKLGRTLGFLETEYNGRRALEHTGGQLGFTSHMLLIPEENLGIFIALNRRVGSMRAQVVNSFLNRYFSGNPIRTPVLQANGPYSAPGTYAGLYLANDYPRKSVEKLAVLTGFFPNQQVKTSEDGKLLLNGDPMEVVGKDLFRHPRAGFMLAFQLDTNGRVTHMLIGNRAYEKIGWVRSPEFQRLTFNITLISLAVLLLTALIAFAARWRREESGGQITTWGSGVLYSSGSLFLLGLFGIFASLALLDLDFDYGLPGLVRLSLVCALLASILAIPLPFFAVKVWMNKKWSLFRKGHYTLVTVCAVILVCWCNYWNLLRFQAIFD